MNRSYETLDDLLVSRSKAFEKKRVDNLWQRLQSIAQQRQGKDGIQLPES